jgi:hypothetical protein
MSMKPIGDTIKTMYPKFAAGDFSGPGKKKIVVTISGPKAFEIADNFWRVFRDAAAKIMEHHPGNVISLSNPEAE